jgi:16S rRNA (cytosine1402-N4)-methyltransferase
MATLHEPVMVSEVVELLAPLRGGLFVDCTVGLGGHTRALLEAGASSVLGCDRDETALALAAERLAEFGGRVELVHADYRDLDRVLDERGIARVAGALADLGVSSMQLDAEGRGFSFRRDEPGISGSIRRRARSRRCASGSTASSRGSTRFSRRRRGGCWPTRASR